MLALSGGCSPWRSSWSAAPSAGTITDGAGEPGTRRAQTRRSALILRFQIEDSGKRRTGWGVVHEFVAISRGLQNEADSLAVATREGNRGTTLHPARSAHTPHADSSGKPLPGPATALHPCPQTRHPAPQAASALPR